MKPKPKTPEQRRPLVIDDIEAVPHKVLAESIVAISNAATGMLNSNVKKRAFLVLLKDSTGISMGDIEKVIDGIANLRRDYVK